MDYWQKRTLANEEKASRLAASYAKRQRQALEKAYKQIENYLNALYVQINYGGADKITRTQLWQYSKYLELEQQIRKELNNVAIQQIEDIKEVEYLKVNVLKGLVEEFSDVIYEDNVDKYSSTLYLLSSDYSITVITKNEATDKLLNDN